MGQFDKLFNKFPKPPTIKPPKPPIINPATGLPMSGGRGGVDIKGNPFGVNNKPSFPKRNPNPFSKHKL
jgi:hypothetical protein